MTQVNTEPRAAVVTGASRGIGRALAIGLARSGFDVVVSDIQRQRDELDEVGQAVSNLGRRSAALISDVSRKADAQELAAGAVAAMGRVDAIVNNAGVLTVSMIDDLTEEQWEEAFAVNAKGTFLVTQAFLPHMKQQQYGRIVNIASIGGKRGGPGQSHYCSAKGSSFRVYPRFGDGMRILRNYRELRMPWHHPHGNGTEESRKSGKHRPLDKSNVPWSAGRS
jgi:NAD(P)-dependent dehydrogenase (short-subunit alcohol dehydrogenase family)